MRLGSLYLLFAVISTTANIGSQVLAIAAYSGTYAIVLSILIGTTVGLVIKYLLDKRYIFSFRAESLAHDGRLFVLYTLMGVLTTFIFWGVEYGFYWSFGTDVMRYLGGVIGLAIGYIAKYRLDKRFVFVARRPATSGVA